MEKIGVNGVLISLIALLSEETGVPIDQIFASTRLDAIAADSLEFVSLVVAVKDKFAANILNERLTEAQTVQDLADLLK
jgi:acyl carrier protein